MDKKRRVLVHLDDDTETLELANWAEQHNISVIDGSTLGRLIFDAPPDEIQQANDLCVLDLAIDGLAANQQGEAINKRAGIANNPFENKLKEIGRSPNAEKPSRWEQLATWVGKNKSEQLFIEDLTRYAQLSGFKGLAEFIKKSPPKGDKEKRRKALKAFDQPNVLREFDDVDIALLPEEHKDTASLAYLAHIAQLYTDKKYIGTPPQNLKQLFYSSTMGKITALDQHVKH